MSKKFEKGYEFKVNGKEQEEWEAAGRIKAMTEKAILFIPEGAEEENALWLPKSQLIEFDDTEDLGSITSVVMTMWIAKKKELTD
jgi:hypothetical protein